MNEPLWTNWLAECRVSELLVRELFPGVARDLIDAELSRRRLAAHQQIANERKTIAEGGAE